MHEVVSHISHHSSLEEHEDSALSDECHCHTAVAFLCSRHAPDPRGVAASRRHSMRVRPVTTAAVAAIMCLLFVAPASGVTPLHARPATAPEDSRAGPRGGAAPPPPPGARPA